MESHQDRVIQEKKELDEKLEKLRAFIGTETFNKLREEDTVLLLRQLYTMQQYSDILQERIDRF